ncbi:RING zinc finger protein-like [Zea mays]|jgi:RING-H2 zinc finger protein RHA1|uniref:Putative RING zinc finger domain superfamily protein n=1 Tax=Zea mays TaxID=4577 RepID=B6SMS1_MAIZE|nr:RING zinc finger protein-like [Zea mays]ACG26154.1 RING zinc finger protein-like [Zea mays]AQK54281.1 Putative RING zinc finger domain superfamily protein [Zea mays]|eukprot:NP_001147218.1 RING zinc finger protein-like [Zea mays]
MGFPVGYSDSETLLPRVLLQALLLLGHLHRFLLWAFHAVGLGDLIDLGCNYPPPPPSASTAAAAQEGRDVAAPLRHWRPEFRPVPAVRIEEALPVVRFDELAAAARGDGYGDCDCDCAVCLDGIGGGDEVRRLGNCRHAFHRACLDRWMAHGQRTCPLCRAPLVPGAAAAGDPWAEAPWLDAADYDVLPYPSTPLLMVPTPTLLRPHELLLVAGLGGGFQ